MTTTYTVTRDQIISSALRKLQVLELGTTPDADTVTNAALSLNLLMKAWQTQGIKLWTVQEYVVPLVANQNKYKMGATVGGDTVDIVTDKPLKVIQAFLRNTQVTPNIDRPVMILSRQEYNILGSKYSTGQINSIWYDPRQNYGELHTYLTPDSDVATNYQLYLIGQKPIDDISASSDIPNFPTEWMQALVWGLADELALEYGCHISQRQDIARKAEAYREALEDWDTETASTYFQVDKRMSK